MYDRNKFYTDWDRETLGKRNLSENDYRNAFEIDRDRVIHSTAFRRLQGKTQVYVTGQSDQYRTRLTHSIEVAQIGRSIVNYLNRKVLEDNPGFHIDAALVEAACLAHDLGNPPIGHKGESRLNELMDPWGGFEGNAQSLRILTDIVREEKRALGKGGMQPTRALLDAILKYKIVGKEHTVSASKFLYPEQAETVHWVHDNVSLDNAAQHGEIIRSVECSIMDLSDDIAYTTSDLFDGFKQNLVNHANIQTFWETYSSQVDEEMIQHLNDVVTGKRSMARFVANLIGQWINKVNLIKADKPLVDSNRYRYRLELAETAARELTALRSLNYELIYSSEYVRKPESEGVKILEELFCYYRDVLLNKIKALPNLPLPVASLQDDSDETKGMRRICDWVAGMTDNYAIRLHHKLKTDAG